MFFSLVYLAPLAWSWGADDGVAEQFLDAAVLTAGLGLALFVIARPPLREMKTRDGFLLVTSVWTLIAAVSALPLLLVYPGMSFAQACFETMSAMTTTGGTIFTDLDHAPESINLWRHLLQWLGGMGLIVLAVAILPMLGVGGMQLYRAETPGPMKDAKLTARIADTAKALYGVYLALTVACVLSLKLAGMSWLDAICHSFSTLSLGGFSTRDASLGAFDSALLEGIVVVFMLLAGVNFATHFVVWRSKDLLAYWRDSEAKAFLCLMTLSVIGVALVLKATGLEFLVALRQSAFNVVSIATTTGFVSVDYEKWPTIVPWFMLLLCGISASSGSTGGGIKMVRTLILIKQTRRELYRLLHPNIVDAVKLGSLAVPNKVVLAVLVFAFIYVATGLGMLLLLLGSGLDFVTSLSAVIASINNTGPGLGLVGPSKNFSTLTDFQLWVLTATMLLGRLEVLSVAVLFTGSFWRK
jgi:trk system potassium uptake protein